MDFNKSKFEGDFEQFLEYVKKISDTDTYAPVVRAIEIVEYVKTHTLTTTQSYAAAAVLYDTNIPSAILDFIRNTKGILDKNFFNWLGSRICESNDFVCMDGFVRIHPISTVNQSIYQKMIENNEDSYLYDYVKSEFIPVELKETILMTFINYGSLKQFVDFTQNCFEFVTPRLLREDIKQGLNNLVKKEKEQEIVDREEIEACNGVMQSIVDEVSNNDGFEKVKK